MGNSGASVDTSTLVPKSLYDANTVLYATTDDTPVALTVGASRIVGRKASGNIIALTGAEAAAILALASFVPAGATVATNETTTSASYTVLATAGPAVTATTTTSALVTITANMYNPTVDAYGCMAVAVSGATTIAASDTKALLVTSSTVNAGFRFSVTILYNGTLTAGSNTFTAQYRAGGGTQHFYDRDIVVATF